MKYFFTGLLLLLFATIATMLPLRPGLKGLSRQFMHQRIEDLRQEGSVANILISDCDIPANAWEGADEFRLNGALYDVVSVSVVNGASYYHCLSDDAEVAAEQTADNLVCNIAVPDPASRHTKLANALMDWLSQLFYESHSWQQSGPAFERAPIVASAPIDVLLARAPAPGLKPPQC